MYVPCAECTENLLTAKLSAVSFYAGLWRKNQLNLTQVIRIATRRRRYWSIRSQTSFHPISSNPFAKPPSSRIPFPSLSSLSRHCERSEAISAGIGQRLLRRKYLLAMTLDRRRLFCFDRSTQQSTVCISSLRKADCLQSDNQNMIIHYLNNRRLHKRIVDSAQSNLNNIISQRKGLHSNMRISFPNPIV